MAHALARDAVSAHPGAARNAPRHRASTRTAVERGGGGARKRATPRLRAVEAESGLAWKPRRALQEASRGGRLRRGRDGGEACVEGALGKGYARFGGTKSGVEDARRPAATGRFARSRSSDMRQIKARRFGGWVARILQMSTCGMR